MTSYARALTRFWWVVVLGICLAVLGMLFVYRSAQTSYVAVARLLVTSQAAPYLATNVEDITEVAGTTRRNSDIERTAVPLVTRSAPDVNTLVRAANMYPFLIESDLVQSHRNKMFGPLPGEVSARALYAILTPVRFDPSEIPIIEIAGEAGRSAQAVRVTQATSDAFINWMQVEQRKAGIRFKDRVVVQVIKRPVEAVPLGGAAMSLLVFIGAAVLVAFVALAIVLDRTFPRRAVDADQAVSPVPSVGVSALATEPSEEKRRWA
jgi:hypothetical protein